MAVNSLPEPIAVVGIGCRLPGGINNPEELWQFLASGRDAWSDVPEDRFNWRSFHHPNHELGESTNHRGGHFLQRDIAEFDARFFGISSMEAEAMDPQQRLQLEVAYEALESAGIPLSSIRGTRTAVFMAIFSHDYDYMAAKDLRDIPRYNAVGTGAAILANRISHAFDLRGPSITLDTGCSGSLVALHQACQSLRAGDADAAFVGGVNLIVTPDLMVTMSMMNMLNDDGKCYTFDSRGDGYGRGEGAGVVFLKRLEDALRDNDPIRAVIRNTAVNFDGKTTGITLPNSETQLQLLRSAYKDLDPRETGYFEAHGTGTKAGDAAEFGAIARLLNTTEESSSQLLVGSIKSNIGHLESASGIAGLIKSITVLEKGLIPPSLNFKTLKEGLEKYQGVKLPSSLTEWPNSKAKRVSVNSFGYGGTNVHAILESSDSLRSHGSKDCQSRRPSVEQSNGAVKNNDNEALSGLNSFNDVMNGDQGQLNGRMNGDQSHANGHIVDSHSSHLSQIPAFSGLNGHATSHKNKMQISSLSSTRLAEMPISELSPQLFVISAACPESLKSNIQNLSNWLSDPPPSSLDHRDLAYTLTNRRSMFGWRKTFVASDAQQLQSLLDSGYSPVKQITGGSSISYIFTGQGALWFAAGRELLQTHNVFEQSMRQYDKILRNFGSRWSLLEELSRDKVTTKVHQSEIGQPVSTAVQMAMVDLLRSFKLKPATVIGHSSGEIAAAYAAGILDGEEALLVAYTRSLLGIICAQRLGKRGAMLAIGLGETEASGYVDNLTQGVACVACINSPFSTTISGDEQAIDELDQRLKIEGIFSRKLTVDVAYHSHHIREVADDYHAALTGLRTNKPNDYTKFFSTVTASEKRDGFGPEYWVQNLVSPVRFADGLVALQSAIQAESPGTHLICVEIGPHSALSGPVRQTSTTPGSPKIDYTYIPTLVRDKNAQKSVLEALGSIVEVGGKLDLERATYLNGDERKPAVIRDLVGYSWDHSHRYWHESRLSRDFRFRKHTHHDLIGTRIVTSTPFEPIWRNVISMDLLPWLRDHIVNGAVLFPGSGYLCMAIEATKQNFADTASGCQIEQFHLKDVVLSKALMIPEAPSKVELQISLRLHSKVSNRASSSWESFSVRSFSDGIWQEHCSGLIAVDCSKSTEDPESFQEEQLLLQAHRDALQDISNMNPRKMHIDDIYTELTQFGNHYGKAFANIQETSIKERHAISTLIVPDVASLMPLGHMADFIIHPTTLDSIFQSAIPLYIRNCKSESAMISSVPSLTICAATPHRPGQTLQLWSEIVREGSHAASIKVSAIQIDADGRERVAVRLSRGEVRGTGENYKESSDEHKRENISHKLVWSQDSDFLVAEDLNLPQDSDGETDTARRGDLLNRVATLSFRKAAHEIRNLNLEICDDYRKKFFTWFSDYIHTQDFEDVSETEASSELENILEQASREGPEGEIVSRIGRNLTEILTGTVEPLSLMLHENLLYKIYKSVSMVRCYDAVAEYLRRVTFKDPNLRVLEAGAGTGGATAAILPAITRNGKLSLDRYDFTDISSGFFENGRTLLERWGDSIQFKVLNIEDEPLEQGFVEESYDYILAANVVHATTSIRKSLQNLHKLLKPGGKLILIELTEKVPWNFFLFGTLPGWWLGEQDGRKNSPLLSVNQWDDVLASASFSGTDIILRDWNGPAHTLSVIISTAKQSETSLATLPISIVSQLPGGPQHDDTTKRIQAAAENLGLRGYTGAWPRYTYVKDQLYVLLDSEHDPLLSRNDEETFKELTDLLSKDVKVLWVMVRDPSLSRIQSEAAMIRGFMQSARFENQALSLVVAHLQQNDEKAIEGLARIIERSFASSPLLRSRELEYKVDEAGQVLIPRLIVDVPMTSSLARSMGHVKSEPEQFCNQDRHLRMDLHATGWLDGIEFIDHEDCHNPLPAAELEIAVMATGLNSQDTENAFGQGDPSTHLIGESAGIVVAVGEDLKGRFTVGDRVACVATCTPLANVTRVNGNLAATIPESIDSFATAASIPVAYLTAYYVLAKLAHLERGQSILIHSADTDIGQASISLAMKVGAHIFATVEGIERRELLVERHGLEPSHVFSQRNFKRGLLRITNGQGVDVALNTLAGDIVHQTCECVGEFGMFVELCKANISQKHLLSMEVLRKNITISTFDLLSTLKRRGVKAGETLQQIFHWIEENHLSRIEPVSRFSMADGANGFLAAHGNNHVGKIILEAHDDTSIIATQPQARTVKLEQDSTYIVAGGLGGLGQEISKWLGTHGAAHVVILSRRHLEDKDRSTVENELSAGNTRVHVFTCSIDSRSSVREVASWCRASLPPVRGVINATMITNSFLITDLELDEFQRAIAPKVHGTRNLYEFFQSPSLSSFIMLSSLLSIIGNNGQANYGAGNSFQDAFAHDMARKGTRIVSINLGPVAGAGALVERPELKETLKLQRFRTVDVTEVLAAISGVLSGDSPFDDHQQIILGFGERPVADLETLEPMSDPLFIHLPMSTNSQISKSTNKLATTVEQSLASATSYEAAYDIVFDALADKLFKLTVLEPEPQNLSCPVVDLGLDSLITIELKNWILRTFQVTIQTFEIADAPSLKQLAATLTSRSRPSDSEKNVKTTEVSSKEIGGSSTGDNHSPMPNGDGATANGHTELPELPLPPLEEILGYFMSDAEAFASDQEIPMIKSAVDEFLAPDGIGRHLQQRLLQEKEQRDNWQFDLMTKDTFLGRKGNLVPWTSNYGTHFVSELSHTQAERAALITSSAAQYRENISDGLAPPPMFNDQPTCGYLYKYLFNTVRKPHEGADKIEIYPDCDYCVVLRYGRVFKVTLKENGKVVSLLVLIETFQAILDYVPVESKSWVGILTSDRRDLWLMAQNKLCMIDRGNEETIKCIDQAAFVVCLDEGNPSNGTRRMHQGFFGDGSNRWHDKTTQFVVFSNGTSGLLFEHSMLDGPTVRQLCDCIHDAIYQYRPISTQKGDARNGSRTSLENGHTSSEVQLSECTITIDSEIDAEISRVREEFKTNTECKEFIGGVYPELGTAYFRARNCPPKSAWQLIIQLALRMYYGYSPAAWEAIMQHHFYKGRIDIHQVISKPVVAFLEAMIAAAPHFDKSQKLENTEMAKTQNGADIEFQPEVLRARFFQAATSHNGGVIRTSRGRGFDRHLTALRLMLKEGESLPALYSDPVYKRMRPRLVMATASDPAMMEVASCFREPDSIWMQYEVWEDNCRYNIMGPSGKTPEFRDCLSRAAAMVRQILEAP